jgi:hypothetical protein
MIVPKLQQLERKIENANLFDLLAIPYDYRFKDLDEEGKSLIMKRISEHTGRAFKDATASLGVSIKTLQCLTGDDAETVSYRAKVLEKALGQVKSFDDALLIFDTSRQETAKLPSLKLACELAETIDENWEVATRAKSLSQEIWLTRLEVIVKMSSFLAVRQAA